MDWIDFQLQAIYISDVVKSLNLEAESSPRSPVFESKSESFILESSHESSPKSPVFESKSESFILEIRVKSQVPSFHYNTDLYCSLQRQYYVKKDTQEMFTA